MGSDALVGNGKFDTGGSTRVLNVVQNDRNRHLQNTSSDLHVSVYATKQQSPTLLVHVGCRTLRPSIAVEDAGFS